MCVLLLCAWRASGRDHKSLAVSSAGLVLPDEALKLPVGHDMHEPADAPPQPLRYWPATHDAAEQVEQTEDPESAS